MSGHLQCPDCDGTGRTWAMVDWRGGGELREVPCFLCRGRGTFTASEMAQIEHGRKLRDDRKARGLTLRQEANRRGITMEELTDLEHGR